MKQTLRQIAENVTYKLLKDALMDKLFGRITQEELEGVCFRWTYEYALKDMRCGTLPIIPLQVHNFYQKTDKQKVKILEDSQSRRGLDKYWNEESKLKATNDSNQVFLEAMLIYFETKNDSEKVGRVREVLSEY